MFLQRVGKKEDDEKEKDKDKKKKKKKEKSKDKKKSKKCITCVHSDVNYHTFLQRTANETRARKRSTRKRRRNRTTRILTIFCLQSKMHDDKLNLKTL